MRPRLIGIAAAAKLLGLSYAQTARRFQRGDYGRTVVDHGRQHVELATIERVERRNFSDEQIALALKPESERRPRGRPRVAHYSQQELDAEITKAVRANEAQWLERVRSREAWWNERLREAVRNSVLQRDREHAQWNRSRVLQVCQPLGPPVPII